MKMSNDEKRSCMKVETGSLIFGVFSAVFWGLNIITNIVLSFSIKDIVGSHEFEDYKYAFSCACGILLAFSVLNVFFSVLLCNGILKKNTRHINAYFVYGVASTILSSMIVVILVAMNAVVLIILAIPIVAYGFILHMIKMTLQKFTADGFNHKRLEETQKV